jgi:NTE family protein
LKNFDVKSNDARANIPVKERALVLQGGGSLGAYEAGAYKALCAWLSAIDEKEGRGGNSTFDIIAGTSIGAMNAAVLTSYVVENRTFQGSAERLFEFWEYLSKQSTIETSPFFYKWWECCHSLNKTIASGVAARRYYSAREFAVLGVPNVFSPRTPMPDNRFFDIFNTWYRFSNNPLKKSLEKFANFPIATTHEKNEPRLILVAVDIADGIPVTFDSYPTEDGSRKTEYGKYVVKENDEIGFEHVVKYDEGITADQVIASGSLPVIFDYANLEVESLLHDDITRGTHDVTEKEKSGLRSGSSNGTNVIRHYHYIKEKRSFWDGGLLANTPLTQLVVLHRKYWYRQRGLKDKVPALGVVVINVHPTKQSEIPTDHDGILNRSKDISFSDKSHREEEVLLLLSDYVDLVRNLVKIAKENGATDEVIDKLMNQRTKYHGQLMKPRQYKEIVEGRFDIAEIVRLERKNTEDTISDKTFDFSAGTINELLNEGYNDAVDGINSRTR